MDKQAAPVRLDSEQAMIAFGKTLAKDLKAGQVVFLEGDLGAGKTTLSKGILAGLGYEGLVTSPTFSLIESYSLDSLEVYHFDLYRLESGSELEMLGARDLFNLGSLCLVEWPDKAQGHLPQADMHINIKHCGAYRELALFI